MIKRYGESTQILVSAFEKQHSPHELLNSPEVVAALNDVTGHTNCIEVTLSALAVIQEQFGITPQIVIIQNALKGGRFHTSFRIADKIIFVSTGTTPAQIASIIPSDEHSPSNFLLADGSVWSIRYQVTPSDNYDIESSRRVLQTWNIAVEVGSLLKTQPTPVAHSLSRPGTKQLIESRQLPINLPQASTPSLGSIYSHQLSMLGNLHVNAEKDNYLDLAFAESLFTLIACTRLQLIAALADDPRTRVSAQQDHAKATLSEVSHSAYKEDAFHAFILTDTGRFFDGAHAADSPFSQLFATITHLKQILEHERNKIGSPPDPLLLYLVFKLSLQAYGMLQTRIGIAKDLELSNRSHGLNLQLMQLETTADILKYGTHLLQQIDSTTFIGYFNALRYSALERSATSDKHTQGTAGRNYESDQFPTELLNTQWINAARWTQEFVEFFMPFRHEEVVAFIQFYIQFATSPAFQLASFPEICKVIIGMIPNENNNHLVSVFMPTKDSDTLLELRDDEKFLNIIEIFAIVDSRVQENQVEFWGAFLNVLNKLVPSIRDSQIISGTELLSLSQYLLDQEIVRLAPNLDSKSELLSQLIQAIVQLRTKKDAASRIIAIQRLAIQKQRSALAETDSIKILK